MRHLARHEVLQINEVSEALPWQSATTTSYWTNSSSTKRNYMSHIDDEKYNLALSCLSAMLRLCFAELRAEQAKPMPDVDAARRLQARCMACYAQRARFAGAGGAAMQAIIDEVGPRVSSRVLAC